MSHSIKHLFHIDANIEKVYEAITTIEGHRNWWTVQTEGDASLGGTIEFRFADHGGPDMKVTKMESNTLVEWECTRSDHGWSGHMLRFELDRNDEKTRVRFSHNNWEEHSDLYAECSFAWGRFMVSLRELCQTGTGQAFGSEGYK